MEKSCQFCNKIFKPLDSEVKRGNGKFCSRTCGRKGQIRKKQPRIPNKICSQCNQEYWRKDYRKIPKHGYNFCSRKCKDIAQKIGGIKEIQPSHFGTSEREYRRLAFRELKPECNHCGYNHHPIVLEVHHRDHDRTNNSLDNLEILCPTCHTEHHKGIW